MNKKTGFRYGVGKTLWTGMICFLFGAVYFYDGALAQESAQKNTQESTQESTVSPVSGFSLEESLRASIEENRKLTAENQMLKKEAEKLKSDLDQNERRGVVYTERIKTLSSQVRKLEEDIVTIKKEAEQAKLPLQENIESLKSEKAGLEEEITTLINERDASEYYRKWNESQEALSQAQATLEKMRQELQYLSAEKESLEARNGRLHYNLGNVYFRKGDYEKAAFEFKTALHFLPEDKDVLYNLAVVYDYYLGNRDEAMAYYMRYLDQDPSAEDSAAVKERLMENNFKTKIFTKQEVKK